MFSIVGTRGTTYYITHTSAGPSYRDGMAAAVLYILHACVLCTFARVQRVHVTNHERTENVYISHV